MEKYGWFVYEYSPLSIRNYITDQTLTITSVTELAAVTTYDGHYSDHEIWQPIRLSIYKDPTKIPGIFLNYAERASDFQNYGYWRRVDDFLVDALLCWPDFFDKLSCRVIIDGGWQNGTWNPKLSREFFTLLSSERTVEYEIAEPYVIPLEVAAPSPWKLVDAENPALESQLNFEMLSECNIPYLPRQRAVEGFQGVVPYLVRGDYGAYIIPSKVKATYHRGEELEAYLYYTYLDDEIFFTFRSSSSYDLELGSCISYGFREFPPRRELWTAGIRGILIPGDSPRREEQPDVQFSDLSFPIWLKVRNQLADAWPAWGVPRKCIEFGKGMRQGPGKAYFGDYGPTIDCGFSGGMRNVYFKLRFWDNGKLL